MKLKKDLGLFEKLEFFKCLGSFEKSRVFLKDWGFFKCLKSTKTRVFLKNLGFFEKLGVF